MTCSLEYLSPNRADRRLVLRALASAHVWEMDGANTVPPLFDTTTSAGIAMPRVPTNLQTRRLTLYVSPFGMACTTKREAELIDPEYRH